MAVVLRPTASISRPATKNPDTATTQTRTYVGLMDFRFPFHSLSTRKEANVVAAVGNTANRNDTAAEPHSHRRFSPARLATGLRWPVQLAVSGRSRRARATRISGTIPTRYRLRHDAPIATTTRNPIPAPAWPNADIDETSPRARPLRSAGSVSTSTIAASAYSAPRKIRATN